MFIHHLATISLISFSYVNNMARVGSLVMCVHDASDFLLEVGEMTQTPVKLLDWKRFGAATGSIQSTSSLVCGGGN